MQLSHEKSNRSFHLENIQELVGANVVIPRALKAVKSPSPRKERVILRWHDHFDGVSKIHVILLVRQGLRLIKINK